MTQVRVEIEGDTDEVLRVLLHLGNAGRYVTAAGGDDDDVTMTAGTPGVAESDEPAPGEWTEALAGEFLAGLDPAARRIALHVWRAGAVGIHRSVLCQHTELTPEELRSLLMHMGHALRRLQRERGVTLSRPVAADTPLRSYFVDPDFATAAKSCAFVGAGRP